MGRAQYIITFYFTN